MAQNNSLNNSNWLTALAWLPGFQVASSGRSSGSRAAHRTRKTILIWHYFPSGQHELTIGLLTIEGASISPLTPASPGATPATAATAAGAAAAAVPLPPLLLALTAGEVAAEAGGLLLLLLLLLPDVVEAGGAQVLVGCAGNSPSAWVLIGCAGVSSGVLCRAQEGRRAWGLGSSWAGRRAAGRSLAGLAGVGRWGGQCRCVVCVASERSVRACASRVLFCVYSGCEAS